MPHDPPLASSLPSAGTLLALALAAALAALALAVLMRRRSDALPLLVILALPFRVPIAAQGRTVNLLIPLYVVIAAGTLAFLLPRLAQARARLPRAAGGAGAQDEMSHAGLRARLVSPRGVQWLLLASVALYALQLSYSPDRAKSAENLAFFYIPFALLFALLAEVSWTRELLLRCLALAAGLAVVFAGVGFVEYSRKELFLNPKVVVANQYDNYFRVNSVFFDPNIYGRYLALVMVALTGAMVWSRARREVLVAAAALVWLLCGLVTSFSQSSIAALLLGLALIAACRWDWRRAVYVSAALLALAALLLLLAPSSLHFGLSGSSGSTSNATSGRTKLISGGLELFAKRPLWGYGSGSFETEYKRHGNTTEQNATSASHTIPVTIAAEQGLLGLCLYLVLVIVSLIVLFGGGAGRSPPRTAIAACFTALVLHTWTYADFLEDPFTWTLLALGVALARAHEPAREERLALAAR
jgi:O-antigen ligase